MISAGDFTKLDVRVSDVSLVANMSSPRVPWSPSHPDTAGPEGWLARTRLLPCHYFVHSFASPATYTLRRPRGTIGASADGGATAHIERNWGRSFPTGWTWAQALHLPYMAGGIRRLPHMADRIRRLPYMAGEQQRRWREHGRDRRQLRDRYANHVLFFIYK